MQFLKLSIFTLFYCLSFSSCTSDDTPPTEASSNVAAEVFKDISYGTHAQQKYDLYLPEGRNTQKTKVLVLVHGGGWTEGDKTDMDGYVTLLQESHPDHAIVNINYVLAAPPSTPAFPNQFLDLQKVIRKLSEEKETLQIKDDFGLIGVSAGAHISLMYDYVYDINDQVKFVCDIVGPTNFNDPFYTENPNFEILLNFLTDAAAYPENTDLATAVSPALQVSQRSSPSILFYGDQDPLVPLSNGTFLANALSESNVTHNFTVYEGGHGNWDLTSLTDLQFQLKQFINLHLPISN
ncbi:alpha/beta hydrolase [Cochleicola gelatinilyticus]|uniref:Alpha/beta hydrolase n=1 Tax=Cochleicola gelatinilyticus TaxID=1763537 RepID=A0A167HHC0_9FLAO|nr:alpha/beta hydrolase [Cochleicola gelatinilyticus]OAB78603.1 alpha/beta hydrolase [Cochleicola gelatinilyticus]